jgi:hypothetical protein
MKLGDRPLSRGANGKDVVELQLRLSGFRGTIWDGDFGPGTELQVMTFQKDVMKIANPSGIADASVIKALEQFAATHAINWKPLLCECGTCGGFGQGRFRNEYDTGKQDIEAFHRFEYPGIHKGILHAYRALWFYAVEAGNPAPIITCGYRCWVRNEQKGRSTTNHMGKALDVDFVVAGEDKKDDCNRCNKIRGLLVEKGNFQVGWSAQNRKALEPADIAPSWIHMDVRPYAKTFLDDRYFAKSADHLDSFEV